MNPVSIFRIALSVGFLLAVSTTAAVVAMEGPDQPIVDVRGDDGLTDLERELIRGPSGGPTAGGRRDIVIVDEERPICYFGLYRTSMMTAPGWDLYERALDWANDSRDHATTTVWLATYNGTLDPRYEAEHDGIAVYDWLVDTAGFTRPLVHVAHQESIETANFTGFDIVLYVNSYPRDATNVLDQDKPFLTTCVGETDEMGIGTGHSTWSERRDYAYIINNLHYVTQTYPRGEFTLEETMWMSATEVAGTGISLISADEPPCDPCDMNCDGLVNSNDIEPFIDLLFDGAPPCDICTGDVNGDGFIDAVDIEGFIICLGL